MAVVITSEQESSFYQNSCSGLRRSHSQAKFSTRSSGPFHTSSSASRIHDLYQQVQPPIKTYVDDSNSSTAPSSPRTIQASTTDLSCSSTPASNLSLSTDQESCDDQILRGLVDDDDIVFPDYNGYLDTTPSPEELEPPPSPRHANSDSETATSTSQTPDKLAVDDTAVGVQPTRHVDYLSHDWREEDIWSSWKHIISNRDDLSNAARLENASWRTWIKAKNKLKTVSPETLNWFVIAPTVHSTSY